MFVEVRLPPVTNAGGIEPLGHNLVVAELEQLINMRNHVG
jgi:hypothetical protein